MPQKDWNFFELIQEGWQIVIRHSGLWWFGLCIALGDLVLNVRISQSSEKYINQQLNIILQSWPTGYIALFALGMLVLLFISLAFFLIRIAGIISIIQSVGGLEKKRPSRFTLRSLIKCAKLFGKQIFLSWLFVSIATSLSFFLLFAPVAILFRSESAVAGTIMAIPAVILFLFLFAIGYFMEKYAYCYIILARMSVIPAFKAAYKLFRLNVKESFIMGACSVGLLMATIIVLVFLFIVLGSIFLVPAVVVYGLLATKGAYIVAFVGILAYGFVAIYVSSFAEAYYHTLWALFFKHIAKPKDLEFVEEKVGAVEAAEEKLPVPEIPEGA